MAQHMRKSRTDRYREAYPLALPALGGAGVFFLTGLLVAMKAVFG